VRRWGASHEWVRGGVWGEGGGGCSRVCSTSHNRRWRAGGDHAMDKDSSKTPGDQALFAGEALFDPIEAGLRGRIRGLVEKLIEQDLETALGRGRYERAGGAVGHRH